METLGKRIKHFRKQKKLTQKELAKALGISRDTLASWEVDRREPDYEIVIKIARFFDVSLDFLLTGQEKEDLHPEISFPLRKHVKVPIYSEIKTGITDLAQEETEGYATIDEDTAGKGEYFFLRVKEDNMAGDDIKPGSLVLVLKQQSLEDGQIGVVAIKDKAAKITVKRVFIRDDQCVLVSASPKYKPEVFPVEDVEVLGKVVEVRFRIED